VLLAAEGSTGYDIVLALHILAVVMGFGGIALSGIHAKVALENLGPAGGAVAASARKAATVAEIFIFLVPILGIGLVMMSEDFYGFDEPWVSASFVLYLVGLGLGFGVLRPAAKRFEGAVAASNADEAKKLYSLQAMVGGIANLIWVVVIFLMVLKPGH
jgi:uncharacterized membrane protein